MNKDIYLGMQRVRIESALIDFENARKTGTQEVRKATEFCTAFNLYESMNERDRNEAFPLDLQKRLELQCEVLRENYSFA